MIYKNIIYIYTMSVNDRARRQYGLSDTDEIPQHMLQDPPPYQPDYYIPSPAPAPAPISTQQRDTIMAQPVIDSGVVVAGDDRALPYSVYRDLMLKQEELKYQLDLCLSWSEKRYQKEKEAKEMDKEKRNKTNGWVIIKDAQDGLWSTGNRLRWRVAKGLEGQDISIEIMKDNSNFGFWRCPKHSNYAGGIVQTKNDLEEILQKYINPRPSTGPPAGWSAPRGFARGASGWNGGWLCDFYVAPGASLKLIKEKIDEGFTIEFEDKTDNTRLEAMTGGGYKKKKSKKKKTYLKSKNKKTKRKKTRRKSKNKRITNIRKKLR